VNIPPKGFGELNCLHDLDDFLESISGDYICKICKREITSFLLIAGKIERRKKIDMLRPYVFFKKKGAKG
jgi:hypothetical protein